MNKPIDLIVDYKDGAGRYYHKVFKALGAPTDDIAGACVIEQLRREGFTACAIAVIYGDHTIAELERIQNSPPQPGGGRLLYIDWAEYDLTPTGQNRTFSRVRE